MPHRIAIIALAWLAISLGVAWLVGLLAPRWLTGLQADRRPSPWTRARLWHRCRDCGWPDNILGINVGRHTYDDGTPHMPF